MPQSGNYTYTLSPYSDLIDPLRIDIRNFLAYALDLPTPYKSSDPLLGERYIGLSPVALRDNPDTGWIEAYSCQVIISGAFQSANGQEAFQWAQRTMINFHHLLPQIKYNVDQQGIFTDFVKVGDFNSPKPRNPARQNGSVAPSDIWVVDCTALCEMRLIIPVDTVMGHL